MPQFTKVLETGAHDAVVTVSSGGFTNNSNTLFVGHLNSGTYNQQAGFYFAFDTPLSKGSTISSAFLKVHTGSISSNELITETFLDANLSPDPATSTSDFTGRTLTTQKTEFSWAGNGNRTVDLDIAPMLAEQVQKGNVQGIYIIIRDKNGFNNINNRAVIRSYEYSETNRASITVDYTAPSASSYTGIANFFDRTEYIPPLIVDQGETTAGTATTNTRYPITATLIDPGESFTAVVSPLIDGGVIGDLTDAGETLFSSGATDNVARRGRLATTDNGETFVAIGNSSSATVYGSATLFDSTEIATGTGVNPVKTNYFNGDLIDSEEVWVSQGVRIDNDQGLLFALDPEESFVGAAEFARGRPLQDFRVYRKGANLIAEIRADKSLLAASGSSYFWNFYGAPTGLSLYRTKTGIRYPLTFVEDESATPQLEADVFRATYPAKDLPDGSYELQGYIKSLAGRITVIGDAQGVTPEKVQVITFTLLGGKAKDYSDIEVISFTSTFAFNNLTTDYDLASSTASYGIVSYTDTFGVEKV